MKKVLLTAFAVICAASVFAQGTVIFNNNLAGTIQSHIYLGGTTQIVGNGTNDFPAGTTSWAGFTLLTGTGYSAALLAGVGGGLAESSLTFGATPQVTTFRGGINAGYIAGITATLSQIPKDTALATMEVFVWNNAGGTLTDPNAALAAFRNHTIVGGLSGTFNVSAVGGDVNTPPPLLGLQSFNVFAVPEPTTMALAGLGAAAMLIFRRRK